MTAKAPGCGRVNCTSREPRHLHVGPVELGDRVVGVPRAPGAPGWTFTNPCGVVTALLPDGRRAVQLDDGRTFDVHVDNLAREKGWHPPKPAKAKTLGRPPLGIDERFGVELDLFGDAS